MRISDWSSDVCSSDLLVRQCEPAFYPAERAEIRTDMASGRAFDRADERSRQHGLPGLDASAVSGQAIDEPRYRTGRIAQHARTEAGLFDCAVARHDRTDPPPVERAEIHDRIADDDARICGIVQIGRASCRERVCQ